MTRCLVWHYLSSFLTVLHKVIRYRLYRIAYTVAGGANNKQDPYSCNLVYESLNEKLKIRLKLNIYTVKVEPEEPLKGSEV